MSERRHTRRIAISLGLAAGLFSAAALAAEATSPAPTTNAAKVAAPRATPAPKRSIAAVSQQPNPRARCQGEWCGRQVVLMLGIGF